MHIASSRVRVAGTLREKKVVNVLSWASVLGPTLETAKLALRALWVFFSVGVEWGQA